MRIDSNRAATPVNTPRQVLFASLIGTTIEFFDFYIYATAAVLVFPRLFFPASDPASATQPGHSDPAPSSGYDEEAEKALERDKANHP